LRFLEFSVGWYLGCLHSLDPAVGYQNRPWVMMRGQDVVRVSDSGEVILAGTRSVNSQLKRGVRMGKTIAEKILSRKANEDVKAYDLVVAEVDMVMGTDTNGPTAMEYFRKLGKEQVFDPKRIAFALDHLYPCPTAAAANIHHVMREFVSEYGVILFEGGEGIGHQLMVEMGYVLPGELIVATDSHTTTYGAFNSFGTGFGSAEAAVVMATGKSWFRVPGTVRVDFTGEFAPGVVSKDMVLYLLGRFGTRGLLYKALEIGGDAVARLSMAERMTITNMAVEMGAKTAVMDCDQITLQYLEERAKRDFTPVEADDDAVYEERITVDVSDLEPMVALPHSPSNVVPVSEVCGTRVDQVLIGYCTNGRYEDFVAAAKVLNGNKLARRTRLIICPASRAVYQKLVQSGLMELFLSLGAAIASPGCGACAGYHTGILADGEVCLATTNRNFKGRIGNPKADIYLGSPLTAAAAAVAGEIIAPDQLGVNVA